MRAHHQRNSSLVTDLAATIAAIPSAIRMVLEPKTGSQCDYGSFEDTRPLQDPIANGTEPAGATETNAVPEVDDLSQEPLIPQEWALKFPPSPRRLSPQHVKIDIPTPAIRDKSAFPPEKLKTLYAFLLMSCSMVATTVTLAMVHERVPDRNEVGPLPDVVLDHVKENQFGWGLYSSEILIMCSTTATFLVVFFHKHRFIVGRRVFLILCLLYLMRCVTMSVTVLPMANKTYYCSPKANSTSFLLIAGRALHLLSGFGLSINGQHVYCGDYLYSGHTVILVLCYLVIQEYTPRRCRLLHWLAWSAAVAGMVFILISRAHYTVDVVVAYYVTTRLFWIYHTLANNLELKQSGPNNFLGRVWWFPAFRYFEANVGAVVPKQFEWPFPRRIFAKHPNREC
ncbi:Hypothetical predicted protein [Cloeon dipterum]|uniref:Sphingomyelin synthase-like domain-containing protein n=2 Tax=Cloeon dipterum TaxID=197152 RepID=A0A8S1D3P0_9INSE|nr:Hypothetical predicted protein [Cloeon dipterum]